MLEYFRAVGNRLEGKECEAFGVGTDVYLSEKDRVIPDVMIICSKDILRENGIYGTPDLVVEILSPGTEKEIEVLRKTYMKHVVLKNTGLQIQK